MTTTFDRQREADAGLFEDWSPWADFESTGRYGCKPPRDGSGEYILHLPQHEPACRIARQIPGAARDRLEYNAVIYRVPAHEWQALRAALPAIALSMTKWARSPVRQWPRP